MKILIALLFFLFGCCMGSFFFAAVQRKIAGESFVTGRSHCDRCGKTLSFFELIPVVSFIFLKGKCRGCKAKISPESTYVELYSGCLFALIYLKFLWTIDLIVPLLLLFSLVPLSIFDLKTNEIPNGFILFNLALTFVSFALNTPTLTEGILSILFVPLPLALIYVFNNRLFGAGDVKLLLSIGGILGFEGSIVAFFSAVIFGGISGIILLLSKSGEKQEGMPFGQFISLGAIVALCFGELIASYYTFSTSVIFT